MKHLGDKIRVLRVQRNLTQRDLARLVGVSAAAIAQWERGGKTPRLVSLQRLATVLEVPMSHFMDDWREGDPGPALVLKGAADYAAD